MSTIAVHQTKDKFGEVVVYCGLADEGEVLNKWHEGCNVGPPSKSFIEKCWTHDARLYRARYLEMIELVPQHEAAIRARPDYPYLLVRTKEEADKCIDRLSTRTYPIVPWLDGPGAPEGTRAMLYKICGFK